MLKLAIISSFQSVIVGELKIQAPKSKALNKQRSLILLKVNAFNADLLVSKRWELKLINHIEVIPINSHEKYKKIKFFDKTKDNILKTNHNNFIKKSLEFGSPNK